ncbi:arylesterase [Corallincola platygyrae]|uniref:arylesterase n=1 Tax=Corallincola platygyrae TaxID=1193278 RepID=UPI003CD0C421
MIVTIAFNRLATLFLLGLVLSLSGCSEPKLTPLYYDATILAFGDSLTAGYGVEKEHSYPAVLAELSRRKVVNAGVSGETTSQGRERFASVVQTNQPDLIILIEGGNDILRNHSPQQAKANLAAMIEHAQLSGIPVVLIGVPEKNLFSSSAPFYRELAEEYDLVFDGELMAELQRSPSLKSDYVHFNKAGYRELAESIYQLLQDNGAL